MKEEEQYKKLKHEIQKLCHEAKDKYYEDKCKKIEMLDKAHSQLLYQKIKELRPKGSRMLQTINEVYTISSEEIESVIRDRPKGKACGSDNISAELLQDMGEKGRDYDEFD